MKAIILSILLVLPPFHKDTESEEHRLARLDTIATSIEIAANGNPNIAGFLIMTANEESHLALHIHEGNCKAEECDDGKAFSLWQFWKLPEMTSKDMARMSGTDLESTTEAAKYAAALYRRKRNLCRSDRGAINAYASGKCRDVKDFDAGRRARVMRKFQYWIEQWKREHQ